MMLEIIVFYGTVIQSFAHSPFQETGNLLAVGTALVATITLIKEMYK